MLNKLVDLTGKGKLKPVPAKAEANKKQSTAQWKGQLEKQITGEQN